MAFDVNKVLAVAEAEVGYLEKRSNSQLDHKTANAGSNNYTKYGRDMHKLYPSVMDFPAAWCDGFVDWCFVQAYGLEGAKKLLCGNLDDYTVNSAAYYKNKGRWSKTPVVGAQIFFKNSKRICHTGLVYKVTATHVYTYEGNTSGASGVIANGGGVYRKSYLRTSPSIAGYGLPDYGTTVVSQQTVTKNYLSVGDCGAAVKTMQTMLIACGYSCGKYGADGDFGNGTLTALKAFQKANNLTVDGKYASKSKAKLEAVYANTKKVAVNTKVLAWQKAAIDDGFKLKSGANGVWNNECIAVAKEAICKKRTLFLYKNLTMIVQKAVGTTADGKFGNGTKQAVINYQKKHGLTADGIVGLNTWKKILNV